jgi:FkbM family methyltransferase
MSTSNASLQTLFITEQSKSVSFSYNSQLSRGWDSTNINNKTFHRLSERSEIDVINLLTFDHFSFSAGSLSVKLPPRSVSFSILHHNHNTAWDDNTAFLLGYEQFQIAVFLLVLSDCDALEKVSLVIDMGCNEGFFASLAAAMGCHVATIDPQSECLLRLELMINYPPNFYMAERLVGLNIGLSIERGKLNASVTTCLGCYQIEGRKSHCYENHSQIKQEFKEVDLISLDELLESEHIKLFARATTARSTIKFLHVDTEGHEIFILKGAKELFKSHRVLNLLIELLPLVWHDPTGDAAWFRDFLRSSGYTCFVWSPISKSAVQLDFGADFSSDLEWLNSFVALSDLFCTLNTDVSAELLTHWVLTILSNLFPPRLMSLQHTRISWSSVDHFWSK